MAVRTIDVRERVMARNDEFAQQVRERLREAGVPAFNLVSSPGAGKTMLLERTLADLGDELGDQRRHRRRADPERRRPAGASTPTAWCRPSSPTAPATWTRSRCSPPWTRSTSKSTDLLFIENVGNLVCPASWDLGENAKIVLFSVTEGEDKPLKYPKMFQQARMVVFTKLDLLPHVPFKVERAIEFCRQVNPDLQFLSTSALVPDGLEEWYALLWAEARGGTR